MSFFEFEGAIGCDVRELSTRHRNIHADCAATVAVQDGHIARAVARDAGLTICLGGAVDVEAEVIGDYWSAVQGGSAGAAGAGKDGEEACVAATANVVGGGGEDAGDEEGRKGAVVNNMVKIRWLEWVFFVLLVGGIIVMV